MAPFVIGQILIGAGVGPLYSLVPAYIDENVRLQSMPIHIMVWYLNLLLGPIISFMAGSFFLQFYVDINQVFCHSTGRRVGRRKEGRKGGREGGREGGRKGGVEEGRTEGRKDGEINFIN